MFIIFFWVAASAIIVAVGCLMEGPEISSGAIASATTARAVAGNAIREADAYKQEITDANQQSADASSKAADAVSRLATAEQSLADATQRELAAEVEVNRLRTPRSLALTDEAKKALEPFKGTQYMLMTFADQESINLTKGIGDALDAMGWIRKEPANHSIGGISYFNIFSEKFEDAIPSCVEDGIHVHIQSKVPVEVLQKTLAPQLPEQVRAAGVLRAALALSVSPSDERNVFAVTEVDKQLGEGPVVICVGRKP